MTNKFKENLRIGNIGESFNKKNMFFIILDKLKDELFAFEFLKLVYDIKYYMPYEKYKIEQHDKIDGKIEFFDGVPFNVKTRTGNYPDILFQVGVSRLINGKIKEKIDYDVNFNSFYFYDKIYPNIIIIYLVLDEKENINKGYFIFLKNFKIEYPQEDAFQLKNDKIQFNHYNPFFDFVRSPKNKPNHKISLLITKRRALDTKNSFFDITEQINKIKENRIPKYIKRYIEKGENNERL